MSGDRETDLRTETFTNARGWTVVRVTHVPTAMVAERKRSAALASPVQAQRECIDELRRALAGGAGQPGGGESGARAPGAVESGEGEAPAPVTLVVSREEFDKLAARVARLERRLRDSRKT